MTDGNASMARSYPVTADTLAEQHDSRVLFMCQCCEEYEPDGAVCCRADIAVMPDGTWLCDSCYSDCEKSAYGMVASDVDDFEFPRFEDLPRPAPYAAPQVTGLAQRPIDCDEIVNVLRAIIVRCDDGDKKSDWLPIISSLAKSVLPKALALTSTEGK